MEHKYTEEEFKSFLEGMKKAAELVRTEAPSYYLVSLNGGGPLFDILRIIDRDVQEDNAVYFPVSSKIRGCREVATHCWENFFLEKRDEPTSPRKVVSIDEVVSGNSVERILNAYNSAARRVARATVERGDRKALESEAEHLRELFPLRIIGLREDRTKKPSNHIYIDKVKKGEILEVPVMKIVTMDDPDFHAVQFAHPQSSGWKGEGYYPTVESFSVTREYLDLLKAIAMEVGINPESVNIISSVIHGKRNY